MTSSAASILSSPSQVTSIVMEYLQKENVTDEFAIICEKEKQTKREVAVYDVFARVVIKQSVSSVIFLDIDGVLFNDPTDLGVDRMIRQLFPHLKTHTREYCDIAATHLFNRKAIGNLVKLISSTKNAAIVLSSSWREDRSVPQLRRIFSLHAFSQFFIDMTPDPDKDREYRAIKKLKCEHSGRAKEIAYWLQNHPTLTNFVILDDRDEGLSASFSARFVKTSESELLTDICTEKAIEILNSYV